MPIFLHFCAQPRCFSCKQRDYLAFSENQGCFFTLSKTPVFSPQTARTAGRSGWAGADTQAFSCYNSSIGKTRIKMQTFRIIAKNPSHENAASSFRRQSAFLSLRYLFALSSIRRRRMRPQFSSLFFFAVINARMRDDIISSCRQRFSSFLLAAFVRSKQRGTSLL